jgi:PilZ domain-containing protein
MFMAILNAPSEGGDGAERRRSPRRPLEEVPGVTGVTVHSERVDVVNAASGGLLVQSSRPLRPGTRTFLEIARVDGRINISGHVIRSEVSTISSAGVRYRSAIAFERRLEFIDQQSEQSVVEQSPVFSDLAGFVGATDWRLGEPVLLNDW